MTSHSIRMNFWRRFKRWIDAFPEMVALPPKIRNLNLKQFGSLDRQYWTATFEYDTGYYQLDQVVPIIEHGHFLFNARVMGLTHNFALLRATDIVHVVECKIYRCVHCCCEQTITPPPSIVSLEARCATCRRLMSEVPRP